jgi:hypothetical protein
MMMMNVQEMAKLGQRAMRKQQSAAEKVFWPLQAGRPRSKKLNLLEAIGVGRTTANRLYNVVKDAGLRAGDAGCLIVFASGAKLAGMEVLSRENQDKCDVAMAHKSLRKGWDPVGVVFLLVDREKSNTLMHARPFEVDNRSVSILSGVLDTLEAWWKERSS